MSLTNLAIAPSTTTVRGSPIHTPSESYGVSGLELEDSRNIVLTELGCDVAEIPFESFAHHILPRIPASAETILEKLQLAGDVDASGWKLMRDQKTTLREAEFYAPLADIAKAITDAVSTLRPAAKVHSELLVLGDHKLQSERPSTNRPDAIQTLKSTATEFVEPPEGHSLIWINTTAVLELKKGKNLAAFLDDVKKLIWSFHHIMRIDPRRRFVLGATLEGSTMRVWFCNRQTVIVSKKFDYQKEPARFITVIASLAFATPSEVGFDATIQLCRNPSTQGIICDIQVDGETYRTTKIISDFKADALKGRATRVWEARALEGQSSEPDMKNRKFDMKKALVVIKDAWIDDDREKEGSILSRMLAGASKNAKRYFLTVLAHGEVKVEVGGEVKADNTGTVHMKSLVLKGSPRLLIVPPQEKISNQADEYLSQGVTPEQNSVYSQRKVDEHEFVPKDHYRIVFAEVCMPLQDLDTVGGHLDACSQAIAGLKAMYNLPSGQWVHRDVSVGNILIYNGQVKISDLEFAQIRGTDGTHFRRTGTPYFTAVEVYRKNYLFANPIRANRIITPFCYSPLHDLESVWWILLWVLCWKSIYPPQALDAVPLLEKQEEAAQKIFSIESRADFFQFAGQLEDLLTPHLMPGTLFGERLLNFVVALRDKLVECYYNAEIGKELNISVFPEAFKVLQNLFCNELKTPYPDDRVTHLRDLLALAKVT